MHNHFKIIFMCACITATFCKRPNAILIHGVLNKYLCHCIPSQVLCELHFDKKKILEAQRQVTVITANYL